MSCGIPQGSLVMAALLTWPSIFSDKLVQDPAMFRFGLACWIWELKYISQPAIIGSKQQCSQWPVPFRQKQYLHVVSCVCSFTPAQKLRCQLTHRLWQHLRPVPESCKYPIFQSIILLLFFSLLHRTARISKAWRTNAPWWMICNWSGTGYLVCFRTEQEGLLPTTDHFLFQCALKVR